MLRNSFGRRRALFLATSSYLCLGLLLTGGTPAKAADLVTKPAFVDKAVFRDHGFISVEGGYLFNGSGDAASFDPSDSFVGGLPTMKLGGDNGWTAAAAYGRTMGPQWDWAIAYRYASVGSNSASVSGANAKTDLKYQHLDLEFGYRPTQWQGANVRLFAGPRILQSRSNIDYAYDVVNAVPPFGSFSKLGNFQNDIDLWGAGPRAGLQASVPLSWATLNVSGSGSAIFSRVSHENAFSFMQQNFPITFSGDGSSKTHSSRTVYNLEGSAALGYKLGNSTLLEVGYQAQQWWNLGTSVNMADSVGNFETGKTNVLTHGPFARITVALP